MAIEFQASEHSFGPLRKLMGGQQVFRYYRYSQSPAWEPAVNIYEDATAYYLCVELPGLEKREITVEVAEQEIRIHGERSLPIPCDPASPECILRLEIDSGRFFRGIRLPQKADMDSTDARLDRGFLWITVRKTNSGDAPA